MTVADQPERHIAVLDSSAVPREGASLSALARMSAGATIGGERFGVELLPNVVARSRGDGKVSTKTGRLGCVGVGMSDWLESARRTRTGRTAPRTSIRLDAGRYAVIEGTGTLAALYRSFRRGFDDWIAASGECPKPGRLYVRFDEPAKSDGAEAPRIALFIPLEELPQAPSRVPRTRVRDLRAADAVGGRIEPVALRRATLLPTPGHAVC